MRRAWTTAHQRTTSRSGYLLRVRDEAGRVAVGDAAAAPGAPETEVGRIGADLARAVPWLRRGGAGDGPPGDPFHPAARHASTQAALTLEAGDRPLASLLGARRPLATKVPVNATLPHAPPTETVIAATAAVATGYRTLKIKVTGEPSEVARVRAVRDAAGPSIAIRLDANGSWTPEDAPELLRRLEPLAIEYVEQPLPPSQPVEFARLRAHSPIPLAADESAHRLPQALDLMERRAVDVVVVKPMALGGLDHALTLLAAARDHGVRAVVTDSVESAVGRTGALHLAATLGPDPPACGLASGAWFERDVVPSPPRVDHGVLHVPRGPGLGLDVPEATAP